jgi:hypothetical protein
VEKPVAPGSALSGNQQAEGTTLMTATEAPGLGALLVCSWSLSWCFGLLEALEA